MFSIPKFVGIFLSCAFLSLLGTLSAGQSTAGQTAGQYIDDATVTASVEKKLMGDKLSNLGRISVATERGVVTLRGMVSSEEEKSRAEDLTRQVAGVTRVENILSIRSIKMQ
jgi:hyperosmotically inducible protein